MSWYLSTYETSDNVVDMSRCSIMQETVFHSFFSTWKIALNCLTKDNSNENLQGCKIKYVYQNQCGLKVNLSLRTSISATGGAIFPWRSTVLLYFSFFRLQIQMKLALRFELVSHVPDRRGTFDH